MYRILLSLVALVLLSTSSHGTLITLEEFTPPNHTNIIFEDITFDASTSNLYGLYRTIDISQARIMVWNPLGTILDDIGLDFEIGIGRGADIAVFNGIIAISDSDSANSALFGSIQRYQVEIPEPKPIALVAILIGCLVYAGFRKL